MILISERQVHYLVEGRIGDFVVNNPMVFESKFCLLFAYVSLLRFLDTNPLGSFRRVRSNLMSTLGLTSVYSRLKRPSSPSRR